MTEAVIDQNGAAAGGADAAAAAATADATKNGNGTAANITASDADGAQATSKWPEKWREELAGNDAEALKRLNRFKAPDGVFKSWRALEQRLSSGELKSALPKDASDEQKAEWRKENGLPAEPSGYKLPTIAGHEWTEDDKPMVDAFLSAAHAANFDQGSIDATLNWYVNTVRGAEEARFNADTQARNDLEDSLRTEWGPEYRGNIGLMKRYLETDLGENGAALAAARMEDGSRLIDQPWFAKWVTGLARETYGDATFVSGDGVAQISNRKREIETIMGQDIDRYFREKLDQEYLTLTQREQKLRR